MSRNKSAPGPKRPEYEPTDEAQRLSYFVEEIGEVLSATGKTMRWGPMSYNPELPVEKRETNVAWLEREIGDLGAAIERLQIGPWEELVPDKPSAYGDPLANLIASCAASLECAANAAECIVLGVTPQADYDALVETLPKLSQAIRFALVSYVYRYPRRSLCPTT